MNTLLILIGISGSGKTTFAKNLKDYNISSYDNYVPLIDNYYKNIYDNLKNNNNVVSDNLNLKVKDINKLTEIANINNSNIEFKLFYPDIKLSIKNLNKRCLDRNIILDIKKKEKDLLKQEIDFYNLLNYFKLYKIK